MKLTERIDRIINELVAIKEELESKSPKLPKASAELLKRGICLGCREKIGDERSIRGCHEKCYRKAMRSTRQTGVSEVTLIREGLLAPREAPGRKVQTDSPLDSFLKEQETKPRKKRGKQKKK